MAFVVQHPTGMPGFEAIDRNPWEKGRTAVSCYGWCRGRDYSGLASAGPPARPALFAVAHSWSRLRDFRNINVMNLWVELHVNPWPGGRMEKLALISQAVSLSVIFYVVTYFLITWQWPETLLSVYMSTYFLYLFIGERDHADWNGAYLKEIDFTK
jgi:hypothetical protein